MRIVRTGHWLYADSVELPVDVVALSYDFWFHLGEVDDQLEPGETPRAPGANGLLYYVRFRLAGDTTVPTWPDSAGYPTIDEAVIAAQRRVPTPIRWQRAAGPHDGGSADAPAVPRT